LIFSAPFLPKPRTPPMLQAARRKRQFFSRIQC
jgi:hypothetical protein